jgi:hypothetical protein
MEADSRRWMMVPVTLEAVIELAEQLPLVEQHMLISRLQAIAQQRALTAAEKVHYLEAVIVDHPPGPAFSLNRADWYNDDGR